MVITDSINNTSLYIRGIYGLQAHSYRHLQLRIDGTDQHIDVSLLAEQALASHGLMSLSMHFRSHFDINGKIVLLGELLNRIDFTRETLKFKLHSKSRTNLISPCYLQQVSIKLIYKKEPQHKWLFSIYRSAIVLLVDGCVQHLLISSRNGDGSPRRIQERRR